MNLNCAAAEDPSTTIYACEADDQGWKQNDDERSFGMFNKIGLKDEVLESC